MNPIHTLRARLALIAQTLGTDNCLGVSGKNYQQLCELAVANDRGWTDLALRCCDEALQLNRMSDEIESLTKEVDRLESAKASISKQLFDMTAAHDWQYRIAGERLRRLEKADAEICALRDAYRLMRNSAAGYSNLCEESAGSRRCEDEYVKAEVRYKSADAARSKK